MMFLVEVGNSCEFCILPKTLKVVVFTCVRQKYMHHDICIVHCYPLGVGQPNDFSGFVARFLAYEITN